MQADQKGRNGFFRATWVALTLVVSLAIGDAVLAPTPASRRPDFIDMLLASRAVVVAVRIALIARRQWLTRVGPVEVSGEVSDLDAENRLLNEEVKEANRVIESLQQKLRIHINC